MTVRFGFGVCLMLLGLQSSGPISAFAQTAKSAKTSHNVLQFGSDVPTEQRQHLLKDLGRLQTMNFQTVTPATQQQLVKVMDLSGDVNSGSLLFWLSERVKMIVSENFRMTKYTLPVIKKNQAYENPNVFPPDPQLVQIHVADQTSTSLRTIMSNIGSSVYLEAKKAGELWGIDIPGRLPHVEATSPRIGLLRIGSGLFEKGSTQRADLRPEDRDASLLRIATLFHEGRHSDGNGKSLGMPHVYCPVGHPYEGHMACEFSLNGSYTVGASVLKVLIEACTECTAYELQTLKMDYVDSLSRTIQEQVIYTEEDRYSLDELKVLQKNCEVAKNQQLPLIRDCDDVDERLAALKADARSRAQIIPASYVDSRPERAL